jgi:hypothetical protein
MSIKQFLSLLMFGQEFADNRRPELNGIGRVCQKMAVIARFARKQMSRLFWSAKSAQEQSQIINSAIGRPVPKAPPIISANAESRFASHGISRSYIPLLHRAPTGIRLSPNDERSKKQTSDLRS